MLLGRLKIVVSSRLRKWGRVFYVKGRVVSSENQHRQKIGNIFNKSMHCEIHSIHKILKIKNNSFCDPVNGIGGTIYIVRLMNTKKGISDKFNYAMGNSAPCKNCEKYLFNYNIKKIKYTDFRMINGVYTNVLVELKIIY